MPYNNIINLLISIDTECDKGEDWKTQLPMKFQSISLGVKDTLLPFCSNYKIRPTFFVSPEIFLNDQSIDVLGQFPHCELATHLHSEYIEPYSNFSAPVTSIAQTNLDPEIEYLKLENLTGLFEEKFQKRPLSFRAGRFGLGKFTLSNLIKLGYKVDSSVTPFRILNFNNGVNNYWGAPVYPYFADLKDPRKVNPKGIFEVPISTSIPRLQRLPLWILRKIGDFSRRKSLLQRLSISPEPYYVRPLRGSSIELIHQISEILTNWPDGFTKIVHIMFHSVELIPGASPAVRDENDLHQFMNTLEQLVVFLYANYTVETRTVSELL